VAPVTNNPVAPFLDQLRAVPFIRSASFAPSPKGDKGSVRILTLRAERETFTLPVELRLSYLDRTSSNAVTALAALAKREGHSFILFARYVPRPTGEKLVAADVNFIDLVGNMHLSLGKKFERTILGRAEPRKHDQKQTVTAAQVQLLFLLAAEPDAVTWPVRKIAIKAGVSKSKAAQIRHQLLDEDAIGERGGKDRNWSPHGLQERLSKGYCEVLRPRLVLGRFRSPEAKSEEFQARLRTDLDSLGVRFSLTGGPAAELLQHFYRGPEIPLFVGQWTIEFQKRLRLLPDRQGPVVILRAFGEPVFWRDVGSLTVAHPWLIYAELMNSEDPRAHEAAEELRREFLPS
jgi:hypothetical protein